VGNAELEHVLEHVILRRNFGAVIALGGRPRCRFVRVSAGLVGRQWRRQVDPASKSSRES